MSDTSRHRSAGYFFVALCCAVAVLAGACAKDETGSGGSGGSAGTGAQGAQAGKGPQPNVTQPTTGNPKPGGKIAYGLEAETTGWNPTVDRWAISGTMVGLAIYDPLAARDDKGVAQPYLAQSWSSSDDFKTWTIKIRENIVFHDGTPVNAAAVKRVFDGHLKSGLTKAALGPLTDVVVVDNLTVQFNMKSPWAVFPGSLTGQLGVIAAPAQLDAGEGPSSSQPIGSGPFKFESWTRDSSLVVKKFPNYWRSDSNGQKLPYLDEVEFRPLLDNAQRLNALDSGQIQMFHTSDGETIKVVREKAKQGKLQVVEDRGESEEGFVMFNTSAPPFDNLNARKAVAYATDRDGYVDLVTDGANVAADGVFSPNSPWYIDSKFPTYNVEEAKKYAAAYQQETGQPLKFTLTVGGPDSKKNGEFLQQNYRAAGMDVEVKVAEQGSFITDGLAGKYQANLWRQFGAPDPDADYQWWISDNAKGALTLNFARNQDPQIDAALKAGRESTDPKVRKDAYAKLQERFTADVPYVWLDRALWAIVATNNVRGIENGPLPDGKPSMPIGGSGFPGVHRLTQTWLAS